MTGQVHMALIIYNLAWMKVEQAEMAIVTVEQSLGAEICSQARRSQYQADVAPPLVSVP